jgi:hypothetical protein
VRLLLRSAAEVQDVGEFACSVMIACIAVDLLNLALELLGNGEAHN